MCDSLCGLELREAERVTNLVVQRDPHAIGMREKHFYDARIELSAGISLNFFSRGGNRQRLAIGPVGNHRVERIGNGEYARAQRNLLTTQAAGIPGPVI